VPGLVPRIHESWRIKDVDGRDKPGHDAADHSFSTAGGWRIGRVN